MKKFLKYLLITLLILVLLVVGAVFLVDPNDFKEEITAQVEKKLGRDFTIDGNISRTFWPNIGIAIDGVTLGNAEGFGDKPFAKVAKMSVGVELKPLFSKEIRVKTVTLSGVSLNLEKNKSGKANWEDFGQKKPAPEQEADATETAEPAVTEKSSTPLALSLEGLTLENVDLMFVDQQSGQKIAIQDLGATIGAVKFGMPFDVTLHFGFDNEQPQVNAKIDLKGTFTVDPENQQYKIDDLNLSLNAQGDAIGKKPLSTALSSDIAIDLVKQTASLRQLKLAVGNIQLLGDVMVNGFLSPQIKANLKTNEFNLKQTLESFGQAPIETTLDSALTRIVAELKLTASLDDANIEQLNIQLDQTKISGNAKVTSFAQPKIAFDINVDDINVDHYLPPAAQESVSAKPSGDKTQVASSEGKSTPSDIPLEPLKALNLNGKLDIQKMIVSKLTLEGISLKIVAKNGLVEITEKIQSLYDGSQQLGVTIDARKKIATYKVDQKLVDVQMGTLLTDMGNSDIIEGLSNVTIDLTARGNNPNTITKNLNGTIGFSFTDGALKWLDMIGSLGVNKEISSIALQQVGFDPATATGKTDFTEFKGTGQLKNGVMTMNDLALSSPKLSAKGKGTINLPEQTLDYKLALQQVKVRENAEGVKEFQPKGRSINLSLTGPLSDPKKSVDVLAMLKSKETAKIEKKLDEKLDKLGIPKDITKDLKKFLPF